VVLSLVKLNSSDGDASSYLSLQYNDGSTLVEGIRIQDDSIQIRNPILVQDGLTVDGGPTVFNESGGNFDFRIEGDSDPNLFFVDASTDNVGIGTSSPALQSGGKGLHINSDGANSEIKFTNTGTGAAASQGVALVASNSSFTINNRSAGPIYINTNNTNAISIDSAQNVGIGTTPSYKFHSKDGSGEFFHSGFGAYVRGTGGNGVFNVLTNASGTWATSTDDNHEFKFWNGNYGVVDNDVLTITDTGLIKQLNTNIFRYTYCIR